MWLEIILTQIQINKYVFMEVFLLNMLINI